MKQPIIVFLITLTSSAILHTTHRNLKRKRNLSHASSLQHYYDLLESYKPHDEDNALPFTRYHFLPHALQLYIESFLYNPYAVMKFLHSAHTQLSSPCSALLVGDEDYRAFTFQPHHQNPDNILTSCQTWGTQQKQIFFPECDNSTDTNVYASGTPGSFTITYSNDRWLTSCIGIRRPSEQLLSNSHPLINSHYLPHHANIYIWSLHYSTQKNQTRLKLSQKCKPQNLHYNIPGNWRSISTNEQGNVINLLGNVTPLPYQHTTQQAILNIQYNSTNNEIFPQNPILLNHTFEQPLLTTNHLGTHCIVGDRENTERLYLINLQNTTKTLYITLSGIRSLLSMTFSQDNNYLFVIAKDIAHRHIAVMIPLIQGSPRHIKLPQPHISKEPCAKTVIDVNGEFFGCIRSNSVFIIPTPYHITKHLVPLFNEYDHINRYRIYHLYDALRCPTKALYISREKWREYQKLKIREHILMRSPRIFLGNSTSNLTGSAAVHAALLGDSDLLYIREKLIFKNL